MSSANAAAPAPRPRVPVWPERGAAPPTSYSFWATRLMCGLEGCVIGVLFGGSVGAIFGSPAGDWAFPLAVVLATLRAATVNVWLLPDGMRARNPFRSYTVRWEDVVYVEDTEPLVANAISCPGVRLRSRRRPLPIVALATWERLVSRAPSNQTIAVAHLINEWARPHGVTVDALRQIRHEHPRKSVDANP